VSDNEQLVPAGVAGHIIEPDDIQGLVKAITEFVDNPELGPQFGASARRWVCEEFSTKRLAENTGDAYLEGLANAPTSH
jgi:glycosyltransferase involved in cell wall biosynthesis